MTLEQYLLDKHNNPIHNFDCSEIAADLKEIEPRGHVVTVRAANGWLKVLRFDEIQEWEYHTFYVFQGRVYDPEYSQIPVSQEKYFEMLSRLNPGNLNLPKSNFFG